MRHLIAILLTLCSACSYAGGRVGLSYLVRLDTARHYIDVSLECELPRTGGGDSILLKMPVWAPGYYAIQDFPKYLTDFAAKDGKSGLPLRWEKRGKNGWMVATGGNGCVVTYRVYANEKDLALSAVNDKYAYIAPNGVFMYVDGQKDSKIDVTYEVPDSWASVSTGLVPKAPYSAGSSVSYTADSVDVLYDSPLLMGNHKVVRYTQDGHAFELAFLCPDGLEESGFAGDFKRLAAEAFKMFGGAPFDNYCLIQLDEGKYGNEGLEHLNSQVCYGTGSVPTEPGAYQSYLSLIAHEIFHAYNVKAIRPAGLGPFDYDREVYTPMLWVSEGFTMYYQFRLLQKAGILTEQETLDWLSRFTGMMERAEGHRHMSLREASHDIWLFMLYEGDNASDVSINLYFKGAAVAFLFDLETRRLTGGKRCLDDLMRLLYDRYYKELRRGFTEEEFWNAAEEVAGSGIRVMRKYTDTTADIDYESFLAPAGIGLDRETWRMVKK